MRITGRRGYYGSRLESGERNVEAGIADMVEKVGLGVDAGCRFEE